MPPSLLGVKGWEVNLCTQQLMRCQTLNAFFVPDRSPKGYLRSFYFSSAELIVAFVGERREDCSQSPANQC